MQEAPATPPFPLFGGERHPSWPDLRSWAVPQLMEAPAKPLLVAGCSGPRAPSRPYATHLGPALQAVAVPASVREDGAVLSGKAQAPRPLRPSHVALSPGSCVPSTLEPSRHPQATCGKAKAAADVRVTLWFERQLQPLGSWQGPPGSPAGMRMILFCNERVLQTAGTGEGFSLSKALHRPLA